MLSRLIEMPLLSLKLGPNLLHLLCHTQQLSMQADVLGLYFVYVLKLAGELGDPYLLPLDLLLLFLNGIQHRP